MAAEGRAGVARVGLGFSRFYCRVAVTDGERINLGEATGGDYGRCYQSPQKLSEGNKEEYEYSREFE